MSITTPGIYALPHADYHADPAPTPSLSAHDAQNIIDTAPRHVWRAHPRLNPTSAPREVTREMEEGAILHRMVLGAGPEAFLIEAADYKTVRAREAREEAHSLGFIPILTTRMPRLQAIAEAVADQAADHIALREVLEAPGRAEHAMLWQEGPQWCRAMPDWLPDNPSLPLLDLKFTARDASPRSYERTVRESHSIRGCHYLRGAQQLRGRRPAAYWLVVVEMEPPHGLMVHSLGRSVLTGAGKLWATACNTFAACLAAGTHQRHWPLYPPVVNEVEATGYDLKQWEAQAERLAWHVPPGLTPEQANTLAAEMGDVA